ncbi:2,3,4,5-tetrahydropyridine-2,6-dicarboxylate N-succinyltransferase [Candidatus Paracaedibacter symbiosus]|uniref:2,3,4,5-tetrahydropyridine-2,6-dicarboxylate N-succinyltransferase n=1 Tax=Candidatus Paracaedibacter symbiosus TaxID=244582 RepID=UPI000509BDB2|nr:2,3,4,5-tetrahydropyridine-2,6-dicarboxylate N-succinyltransferase [Candidatus Paracaedibacter symbiosus]
MTENLQKMIETAWDNRDSLTVNDQDCLQAVITTLTNLDQGLLRVATKTSSGWVCHDWIKKAILLSFKLSNNKLFTNGPSTDDNIKSAWFDKIPLKTQGWNQDEFRNLAFRVVPGAIIRHSAFISPNVVLMPSFINVGAYIGEGTMVDTWATIGSCAQIGKNCHISGGVGIGGVLEPLQANPVIIEDNCFIGARSEIAEGVIVEEGAVISMGVFIGASTKIVDRQTGKITYGRVPPYSVVVPGTLPGATPTSPSLACAVIVKQVDAKTRSKTGINELLRT